MTYRKNWPITGASLDFIKIMAAVLMVIDHINLIWFDLGKPVMLLLGRGAFPLFAYAVACAMLRSGTQKAAHYTGFLLVFAVFAEPFIQFSRDVPAANVLFTLAIGAAFVPFMARLDSQKRIIVLLFGILSTAGVNYWEFGIMGALLPSVIYLFLKGEKYYGFWLVIVLALVNISEVPELVAELDPVGRIYVAWVAVSTVFIPYAVIRMAESLHSPKRLLPKYFLHVFYPAHFVVLALIGLFI